MPRHYTRVEVMTSQAGRSTFRIVLNIQLACSECVSVGQQQTFLQGNANRYVSSPLLASNERKDLEMLKITSVIR